MKVLIEELIGKTVEIRSQAGQADYRDDGVLEACDERWLRLRKGYELIYFPINNVRLVKPLD